MRKRTSELRTQLEAGRRAYEAAAYPGDLAAELLAPPRRGRWRWLAGVVGVGASVAAAAVAVLVFRMQTADTPNSVDPAKVFVDARDSQEQVAPADNPAVADTDTSSARSGLSVPRLPKMSSMGLPSISPSSLPRPSEIPRHIGMTPPPINRIAPPALPRMPSLRGRRDVAPAVDTPAPDEADLTSQETA